MWGIVGCASPPHQPLRYGSRLLRKERSLRFRGRGVYVGNVPLHYLLLLNRELAACLFRPSLLSPEGFPASLLEAFPPTVVPGPTDFQFIS